MFYEVENKENMIAGVIGYTMIEKIAAPFCDADTDEEAEADD